MNGARRLAFVFASFLIWTVPLAAQPAVPGCNGKCATLFSADDGGWGIYTSGGTWGACDTPSLVGSFANVLVGTASADVIVNQYTAAGVRIYGGGGNDTVCGSSVGERIVTLDGDDWISSGAGVDYVFAGGGSNTIDVGMESDTDSAFAGSGGDTFVANAPGYPGYATDVACLGDGANVASSYVSGLKILTGSGPDIVSMSSASDSPKVFVGTGSDSISLASNSASSTLVAGSSSATITASPSSFDYCQAPIGATLSGCDSTLVAPDSAICVGAAVLDETAPTVFNFNVACDLNRDGDTLDANESRSWDLPAGGGVRIEQFTPTPAGSQAASCTITETSATGNEHLTVSCTRTKADGVAPDPTYGTVSATIIDVLRDTIQCQFVRATPTVVESCVGQPFGTACDDGNACTQDDICDEDVCSGESVICAALDQCHVAGTCDPATGTCDNPQADDGTTCDDSSLCTQADACIDGACIGSDPVTCLSPGQCYGDGTCDPGTGDCSISPLPAGTSCNASGAMAAAQRLVPTGDCDEPDTCDGAGTCQANISPDGTACNDLDACTQTDTCTSGTCVGGNAVVCSALDSCHEAGTCNSTTGECSNPAVTDGTLCEDGDACTGTDACQSGVCVGSDSVICTAMGPCYEVGTCDSATGECSNPFSAEGTACSAGPAAPEALRGSPVDLCDQPDTCDGEGTCLSNVASDGSPCDDSNLCTQGDSCLSGSCESGTPVVCSDLGECYELGSCDTSTGICSNPFSEAGTACGDGTDTACTDADSCNGAGDCVTNDVADWTPCGGDDCNTLQCLGGTCAGGPVNEGGACDDGNDCTTGTTCSAGICQGGTGTVCDSPGECERLPGTCEPGSDICTYEPKAAGTACGDTDPLGDCDAGDSCDGAGDCRTNVSEAAVVCREAAGECDLEETCDGSSVDCPADEVATADTPCGDPGSGDCTEPDSCDAEGVCQPHHLECGLVTGGGNCLVDKYPGHGVCVGGTEDCSPCVFGDAGSACVLGGGACEETRDFRLVFTPDVKLWPAHKLNATNAGQHRYNLFVEGIAGEEQTVTIEIPFPFVTSGADPVHAYDAFTTGQDGSCFSPVDGIPVSQAWVSLADWSDGTQGGPGNLYCDTACGPLTCATAATCTFDVTFTVPESGMTYVQVHLDYGLKGTSVDGNPCDTLADRYDPAATNPAGGRDALENNASQDGEVRIADGQAYEFAHSVGAEPEGGDTIHSTNEFKRIAGVLGLVSTSEDGNGVVGATVELLRSGKLVARATTDVDGFYAIAYRHKGKAATYTVRYRGETPIARQIQLKANGWVEVNFDLTTGSSSGQVGSGAVR